ncbi:alkaline phosphatase [Leifsonia sp. 98AMF]|uniref:alkaline phosphatase n=1 Tax=unclassified Leifsonia TaxID=2663824 RepID=UPI00087A2EF0|nr:MULTISPECIES: alkaline phosphatase [unclassified Leifsonia]SDH65051.1 alkaline phosphatase [Leifsonia sp. 197AMF]SDI74517.1 alkaline phosphatase [Leifsonia sp. 466MF]SDK13459.1 alkaline phosphatase [Leifsonia sp. 157MF]SDN77614.1 alkaline phosphatase [Leifsonia sp. 509MF]SEN30072.1 alkaline phosphatase [Leifsonia sp. 467MF]
MFRSASRWKGGAVLVAASGVLAAALLPAPALAATSDNGGAARNPDDSTTALRQSIVNGPAKNVILLIGDGMGDSEITVARNYQYGAGGMLPGIDALPLTGQYTTYSVYKDGANKGKPDYVPDSAATGSAWATGTKTYDNAISVDIDGKPQATLLELARANGLRTGNVSTAEIQDATPAVEVAHVGARSCYGPDSASCGSDALENGGLGSISEQLLDARADVTLGGGSTSFTQTAKAGQWKDETLFDQAAERGYQVVGDAAGLAGVAEANQQKPLLGLFTPGNFPTRYASTTATVGGADQAPVTCTPNPARLATDLSLSSLTNKAISLLDKPGGDGFFLQVEGASIDKRDHSADACGQIGETVDLDEAVQAALAFAKKDGNTLVIVTADHAHTSQIVDSTPPATLSTALTTADGTVMKVAYGTAAAGGSQQHTGAQLRIAGYGPGAADVVGLTDQSDTFFTIARALELNRDYAALSAGASVTLNATTVKPGDPITATLAGFRGDRQVTGVMQSDPVALPRTDVLGGSAAITATAPTDLGAHTITVTGAQSGKAVTVNFEVTADGQPSGALPGGSAGGSTGGGNGAVTAGSTSAGSLASTGSIVAPLIVVIALALLIAGYLFVTRGRRRPGGAPQV